MAVSATLGTAISKAVSMSATLRGWRLGAGLVRSKVMFPCTDIALVALAV